MTRVKRGVVARKRHKKLTRAAKGMQRSRRTSSRLARQAVTRSLQYAYRDRRTRKRELRKLWITRINAAAREQGLSYSQLVSLMAKSKVELDRKVLSELAVKYPEVFKTIVDTVKGAK